MKPCNTSIMGRIFGHKFKKRIISVDYRSPQPVKIWDIEFCKRCGEVLGE